MNNQPEQSPGQASPDTGWYGIFYYAPHDERVIVPKRSGWGSTVNFAQPMAYVILSLPFVLGAIIVVSVWFARR